MAVALGIVSLLAQAAGIVGIGFLIHDLAGLPGVFFPDGNWTMTSLLPYALETAVSYWTVLLLCVTGAAAAAILMIMGTLRAGWFLGLCRILGWLWLPLLPIGPILGIVLLRARVHARGSQHSPDPGTCTGDRAQPILREHDAQEHDIRCSSYGRIVKPVTRICRRIPSRR